MMKSPALCSESFLFFKENKDIHRPNCPFLICHITFKVQFSSILNCETVIFKIKIFIVMCRLHFRYIEVVCAFILKLKRTGKGFS